VSKLLNRQFEFARAVSDLIRKANSLGYDVTLGDAYRDPRCKYGYDKSLHKKRLAIDLNLFKKGVYLNHTEDHRELGEWWEHKYKDAVWGGSWGWDGNHYQFDE
jgi:hypothetical protein